MRLVLGLSDTESNRLLPGSHVDLSDLTVFVVWRDRDARRHLAALVSSLGVGCCPCESAEEFLENCHPGGIGCVVLELQLPGMSGLELLEYLPDLYHPLPAILAGTGIDVRTAVRAMQAGAVAVFDMSWDEHQLVEAIQAALGVSESNHEAYWKQAEFSARFEGLDERERGVVTLLVDGRPHKAIARELGVSHRTIDRICAKVYQKMGTESAVDLARTVGELSRSRVGLRESRNSTVRLQSSRGRNAILAHRHEQQLFVDHPHRRADP